MSRSLCRRFPVTTPTAKRATYSQPFNSSTPVLYYNKDAFKKAGLDPEQPPKNRAGSGGLCRETESLRYEVRLRQRLAGAGSNWKNFSARNGLPFASKNNGFDGTDAVLEFNKPEQVKHIAMLEEMNKKGDFSYVGRKG
ncbi:extracellular solute-binding protein [Escherichia coli]